MGLGFAGNLGCGLAASMTVTAADSILVATSAIGLSAACVDRAADCAKVGGGGFLPAEAGRLIAAGWSAGIKGCRSDVRVMFDWVAISKEVLSFGCTAEKLGPACTLFEMTGVPTLLRSCVP